ncbi:thiamine phosphate synthase [Sphingomonas sp. MMS12-HWE2-04]|uniref:thiamine phosphate synthase n=1 Tax=Sphingomonas sp. MMS12-HWE2-04 TaxID=3234199 RepID=UPI00384F7074
MPRRHPLPTLWLMTDERMGDALWEALGRLPRGAGVVFRHYGLPLAERRALFARVSRIARRRGLVLVRAGTVPLGKAAGVHGARGLGLRTRPAHSRSDAIAALRAGADALFVSPVFATRSHPGARALEPLRFALLVRGLHIPIIALGGMTSERFKRLKPMGIHGWAAIDAWSRSV